MEPLAKLFGSSARLKLLRLFLYNQSTAFSIDEAAARAKVGKPAVRGDLAAFLAAKLVVKKSGHPPRYKVNAHFEHLPALDAFIRETTNVRPKDVLAELKRAGTMKLVALSGHFTGVAEAQADLLVVGDNLHARMLANAVRALEAELGREIRYAAFSTSDFRYRMGVYDRLLRDIFDYPHRLLVDKIGLN